MRKPIFETDLGYVYLTRNTYSDCIEVWDPNVGIRKEKGCIAYYSAAQFDAENKMSIHIKGRLAELYLTQCQSVFGGVPEKEEAWLVNIDTGTWKRVDQDMLLINGDTGEVIK